MNIERAKYLLEKAVEFIQVYKMYDYEISYDKEMRDCNTFIEDIQKCLEQESTND